MLNRSLVLLMVAATVLGACARDRPLETPCPSLASFQSPRPGGTLTGMAADASIADVMGEAFVPRPGMAMNEGGAPRYSDALILSGGGQWGAYGAGVIEGWSARGRLDARIVTGVSTGALQATFAYLGPAYDRQLIDAYTIKNERVLVKRHGSLFFLRHGSMGDIAPLKSYIQQRVGPLLGAVEAEYEKTGRKLLVGAVDGLGGTFHVFDLTRMASELSGTERLNCYTAALLASSSVPVVFRQTTINGRPWLDGGIRKSMFLPTMTRSIVEARMDRARTGSIVATDKTVFALRNGMLAPTAVDELPAKLIPTISRLVSITINQVEQDSLDLATAHATRAGLTVQSTTADAWRSSPLPECKGQEPGLEDRVFDRGFMICMIRYGQSRWDHGQSPWAVQSPP